MKFAASLWCFYDVMTSHLLNLHQLTSRKQLTVREGSLFKSVLFKRLSQDRKLPESVSEKQRSSDNLHHPTEGDLHLLNAYLLMAQAGMDQNCSGADAATLADQRNDLLAWEVSLWDYPTHWLCPIVSHFGSVHICDYPFYYGIQLYLRYSPKLMQKIKAMLWIKLLSLLTELD